jgi:hypothetical protein
MPHERRTFRPPQVGDAVWIDTWQRDVYLLPCDWPAAEFRVNAFDGTQVACNVRVTGRDLQRRYGTTWIRAQVEFPQDEPAAEPVAVPGWLARRYADEITTDERTG